MPNIQNKYLHVLLIILNKVDKYLIMQKEEMLQEKEFQVYLYLVHHQLQRYL